MVRIPSFLIRLWFRAGLRARDGTPFSRTRTVLALKAAVAAVAAWYVATLVFDGTAYPYYAPLGALLAMNFSVAASVRDSARAIGAILLGLLIAVVCDITIGTSALGVAAVVGLGVFVAGLPLLGTAASWVPTSALFVLILAGSGNIVEYVSSYGGLTLLGMIIGLVVNVVFPAHPLAEFDPFAARMRTRLADQLDALVEGLSDDDEAPDIEWENTLDDMLPTIAEVRAATQETAESTRGNPRARWHRGQASQQYAHAQLLERATFLTEELTQFISEGERSDNRAYVLGQELRAPTVRTIRAIAGVLRQSQTAESAEVRKAVASAHKELRQFEDAVRRAGAQHHATWFHAGGIAVTLRRSLRTSAALAAR